MGVESLDIEFRNGIDVISMTVILHDVAMLKSYQSDLIHKI